MVMKRLQTATTFFILLLSVGLLASQIYSYGNAGSDGPFGSHRACAAVWGTQVSPVFKERINHGIDLYQNRKVRK